jgi:flagellar operon protein
VIDGIGSIGAAGVPASAGRARPADGFDSIFRRELVKFSKHAEERLQRDGIHLTDAEKERLDLGMDKAAAKGARSSVLLMDDKVFIANVREKIVITSMTRDRLRDNVFTQIDSAVVVVSSHESCISENEQLYWEVHPKPGGTESMMPALFSGVSGLKNHQFRMNVIGNNLVEREHHRIQIQPGQFRRPGVSNDSGRVRASGGGRNQPGSVGVGFVHSQRRHHQHPGQFGIDGAINGHVFARGTVTSSSTTERETNIPAPG